MTAAPNATAVKILECAEHMARTRGFNGFSYKDISAEVGIKTASIHYYFSTKNGLACALLDRCRGLFAAELDRIDGEVSGSIEKLEAYAGLFERRLARGRNEICIFGMFAAEAEQLPAAAKAKVAEFFADNVEWLRGVLAEGRTRGELRFAATPERLANQLLATFEGGMLLVRSSPDAPERFRAVSDSVITMLRGGAG